MFTVYIVENLLGKIYIGCTHDFSKRIESHNRDNWPDWTQGKGPWKLIFREDFQEKSEALTRERFLKSLKAGQKIKKILRIV